MRVVKLFLPMVIVVAACARESTPSEAQPVGAREEVPGAKKTAEATTDVSDRPEQCKTCHPLVYEEWAGTMHAASHHSRDPLYAAVRRLRIEKEGDKIEAQCGACHNPRSFARSETPAAKTGVSCATCHNVEQVRADSEQSGGRVGAQRLRWARPEVFLGPHNLGKQLISAHKLGYAPEHMKDGAKLCLACHGELKNTHGQPLCTTGVEWEKSGGKETCVSCHMPLADGPGTIDGKPAYHRSHRFIGPRAGWANKDYAPTIRGVKIDGTFRGQKLTIRLKNNTSHSYPSGFPGRMLIVKAVGRSENDETVWTNFEADPMKESPKSVLNKIYVDAAGQPTLAATGIKLSRDTRLTPNETRELTFKVPRSVHRVDIKLLLGLLPAKLADKLGLTGSSLTGFRPIAEITIP